MKYTYPKTYKIKSVREQFDILRIIFPNLSDLNKDQEVSTESEGIFVIPHWKLIGKTYNDSVLKVLGKLKDSRSFYDWRNGNWQEKYLKQTERKEKFWNVQKKEVLLINAQFGLKHANKSVKTVRESLLTNELPFGIYEVGIMLLTHPERLQEYDDLWIDCPGDNYSLGGVGDFSQAPDVSFDDGQLETGTNGLDSTREGFGSASGFVPQV